MAKKISAAKKSISFSEIRKSIDKLSEYGGMMDVNEFSEIDDWIPTGNYILNAAISGDLFKGVPGNRMIGFGGESGSGKTFLMLNIAARAQKAGYSIVWFDSETAIDKAMLKNFGVDSANFRYEPIATVQEFRTLATNILDEIYTYQKEGYEVPKIAFFLDSLGNLATNKEIADAQSGSDKADMTRAKLLRSLFRVIALKLSKAKIPLFLTNHTYNSQEMFSKPVFSGGGGAIYNCSMIGMLAKSKLKETISKEEAERGMTQNGIIVKFRPYKNRFCKPLMISFYIDFTRGMNPYVGLHNFVSWETCGIQKDGKIDKDGEFIESKNGKYAVKHLGRTVSAKDLFKPEVFTQEVLEQLNEKVIKPMFSFPDGSSYEDFYSDVPEYSDEEIEIDVNDNP